MVGVVRMRDPENKNLDWSMSGNFESLIRWKNGLQNKRTAQIGEVENAHTCVCMSAQYSPLPNQIS